MAIRAICPNCTHAHARTRTRMHARTLARPCARTHAQATEAIRAGGGLNADTPIVAVTANAMKGDREKVPTPRGTMSTPLPPPYLSL